MFVLNIVCEVYYLSFISGSKEDVTKYIEGNVGFGRTDSKTGVRGPPAARTSVTFMKNLGS